ncbi:unnamed protein product, partial [Darwinula stevensoni]
MIERGNPRNKVALAPGRSLMDWIRLGNSGEDLTGVGGARKESISVQELALHNHPPHDVWIAIRGTVRDHLRPVKLVSR